MALLTSDGLLASIKRGISQPNNQNRFSDEDLLAFADEELATLIMPEMLGLREEYGIYQEVMPLVSNQSAYDIPSRALGRTLRDLEFQQDRLLASLAYITPADRRYYTNGTEGVPPTGFYFENDKLVVVPNVGANPTGNLVARFTMRHSKLVKTALARTVTNINTTTNEVTVNQSFGITLTAGQQVDFIKASNQPVIVAYNQLVANISDAVLTFAELPAELKLGDYVSLAETTPILLLPEETHQVVAQAVQCRILESQGDADSLKISTDKLNTKIKSMRDLLSPRIQGEVKVVMHRNGLLRSNARSSYAKRIIL